MILTYLCVYKYVHIIIILYGECICMYIHITIYIYTLVCVCGSTRMPSSVCSGPGKLRIDPEPLTADFLIKTLGPNGSTKVWSCGVYLWVYHVGFTASQCIFGAFQQ